MPLILAQKIIDMLDETSSSGMEKWDALNIALRLVDIRQPAPTSSDSSEGSEAEGFGSWPTELEPP
jgi:hypothetical protein